MVSAVIVSGGKGTRMGLDISKQYIRIFDIEILAWTVKAFEQADEIDQIVLVVPADDIEFCSKDIVLKYGFKKVVCITAGGEDRVQSVYNGLRACNCSTDIVLIHDGVRPLVDRKTIIETIIGAKAYGAAAAAVPVKDTIKISDENKFVEATLDRSRLYSVQTPQAFKYELILKAHQRASQEGVSGTDDAVLVERLGEAVKLVDGSYQNIKITTPEDLILMQAFLKLNE